MHELRLSIIFITIMKNRVNKNHTDSTRAFWEQSEQVERFAARDADKRLRTLLRAYPEPEKTRILDLGCAGGRNTVLLAEAGFNVYAVDASLAMVKKTRERLTKILGTEEAARRVLQAEMEDLRNFDANSFQLVVALGVYHNAQNLQHLHRAVEETARILASEGQLLVANFSPESAPNGTRVSPVPGAPHMYEGFSSGPLLLLAAETLDAKMMSHGLIPIVATETVTVKTDIGQRVTVNALYGKRG